MEILNILSRPNNIFLIFIYHRTFNFVLFVFNFHKYDGIFGLKKERSCLSRRAIMKLIRKTFPFSKIYILHKSDFCQLILVTVKCHVRGWFRIIIRGGLKYFQTTPYDIIILNSFLLLNQIKHRNHKKQYTGCFF